MTLFCFFGAQTNIELDKHQKVDKHRVGQTPSWTYTELDKYRVGQIPSWTIIELVPEYKCLLRQTSSWTDIELLHSIYNASSTGTYIELDKHQVGQTSSKIPLNYGY